MAKQRVFNYEENLVHEKCLPDGTSSDLLTEATPEDDEVCGACGEKFELNSKEDEGDEVTETEQAP